MQSEATAAKIMLDKVHPLLSQSESDHSAYTLGSTSGHDVVVACLQAFTEPRPVQTVTHGLPNSAMAHSWQTHGVCTPLHISEIAIFAY